MFDQIKSSDIADDENILFCKKTRHDASKKCSSGFIGVSKNGNGWQIINIVNKERKYIGSLDDIKQAAIVYDIVSIACKGIKCKTNFTYTKKDILCILNLPKIQ
jgi:hypothetical protein